MHTVRVCAWLFLYSCSPEGHCGHSYYITPWDMQPLVLIHSHFFDILTHSSSLPLFTLLTPITPLCWQRAFPVPATEKALLLPPKCWHAQRHPSSLFFYCTPSFSHCLYCSPHPISVSFCSSLCHQNELWVIFCVFWSLVVLCKVAVSFNLMNQAGMRSEKRHGKVHNPVEI